jgi:hypothetical protein
MMAALLTGVGVVPAMVLRKNPLPASLHRCMEILSPQGVGKAHRDLRALKIKIVHP